MARRRKLVQHSNTERWLLTYADLITLLLAFFIVMYSMSRLDADKFDRMSHALGGALRGDEMAPPHLAVAGRPDLGQLLELGTRIQEKVRFEGLAEKIAVTQDERGLVIRVLESAAFDPGSAELKPQMHSVLGLLASELGPLDNHLRVEGHTDDLPISTVQYPSNWELSTNRATGVVRYLVEVLEVDPARVSALGYGEFRPVADNQSADGRARNRRVDLIVLADSSDEPAALPHPAAPPLAAVDSAGGR